MPVPRRALVVDDSAASRHRVATLLTVAGYQVLEAVGADAALRSAARFSPELVVTAVQMRSGDGVALLQQLRRHGSHARFVALTTRRDARVQAAVAALGGSCLSTPVDPRQLVELLRGPTTGRAAQGTSTPLRVTAERLDGADEAPPSTPTPSGGYRPTGALPRDTGYGSRLPVHLARMAASASSHREHRRRSTDGAPPRLRLEQLLLHTSGAR